MVLAILFSQSILNMSNVLVLNSRNAIGSSNNTFQYNFMSGAYVIGEGSEICVSNITIPYSWYNIQSAYYNNTSFQYNWTVLGVTTTYTVTLPDGYYTVSDINQYLQGVMINAGQYLVDNNGNNVYYISLQYDAPYYAVQLICYAVPTALPAGWVRPSNWLGYPSVASTPQLIISASNNFDDIIGFTAGTYPTVIQATNYSTLSNKTPVGSPVNSIIVRCNLVANNVISPSDILDSFPITSAFGTNINYSPNFEKWIKLKQGRYTSLTISFSDQNFNLIPANDPNVLITLLIKQK